MDMVAIQAAIGVWLLGRVESAKERYEELKDEDDCTDAGTASCQAAYWRWKVLKEEYDGHCRRMEDM